MNEVEFRQLLDGGLDTWSALREAGYEAHARNVYRLRRYAIENPPPDDIKTVSTCECGCGEAVIQPTRGRPRRYVANHRQRRRKATK
jgi:hypothetical protein